MNKYLECLNSLSDEDLLTAFGFTKDKYPDMWNYVEAKGQDKGEKNDAV